MTRICTLTALLTLLLVGCNSQKSGAADESVEPPMRYSIKVGEKAATLSESETIQLEGTFANPKITVTAQPHRVFPYQGVQFNYPRAFAFESDLEDQGAKSWTLSGSNFKIMYFVLNASVSTAEFANTMIDQFGRESARIVNANATITLGKEKLTGTSLQATIAKHKMVIDIYRVPSRGTKTKLLVFQDSLDDLGNRSKESQHTLAEIKSSFAVEQ